MSVSPNLLAILETKTDVTAESQETIDTAFDYSDRYSSTTLSASCGGQCPPY